MIRLILVDDQPLFRQGLASLLSLEEDLEIVGEANNGKEAITLTSQLLPDIVLMDVRMPVCNGVEATREIHERYPWIRILVLTTFDDDEYVWQSLEAGALSYLLKSTPAPEVAAALRALHQGHSQLGPTIAAKIFSRLKSPQETSSQDWQQLFTKQEQKILQLLGQGKNNKEIAATLHLTEGTVKNYLSNIFSALGVRDRTQAALWVQKNFTKMKGGEG